MFTHIRRTAAALGIVVLSCFGATPAVADDGTVDTQVELTGSVQSMPGSGLIGSWTIAGKGVQTDSSTKFDQENGQIGVGALVEVKGTAQSDGSILADQIEVKVGVSGPPPPPGGPGTPPPGDDEGDFTGAIEGLPVTGLLGTWQVAGKMVQVVSTTRLEQEGGGFAVGAIVEVEGLPDANGVIVASKIELKGGGTSSPQPEPDDFEIVGTIGTLPADGLIGTWLVAGRSVVVTADTELDAENGAFAVGVTVEVKGALDLTGAVVAARVESMPGSGASEPALEFFGTIDALPAGASGLIGVWSVDGKLVNVTAQTVIDADQGPIVVGTAVEVSGWQQPDGMIDAQKIEVQTEIGAMSGVGPQAVEFFNSQVNDFFVTASTTEIAALDAGAFGGVWQRTGQTFNVGGTMAVCRFYGMPPRGTGSHFFTADPAECSYVMAQYSALSFEGHAFAVTPAVRGQCPPGLLPVTRFFNNPATTDAINHRLTATQQAFDQTVAMGWINEGVVMCTQP